MQEPPQILVVEDELLIRMVISEALRDEGYRVIEAFNADEALDVLNAGLAPSLILSDVRMPGSLDGLGLLKLVKQRFPTLPVIVTSGHLEPRLALRDGAAHFLRKPFATATALDLIALELSKLP